MRLSKKRKEILINHQNLPKPTPEEARKRRELIRLQNRTCFSIAETNVPDVNRKKVKEFRRERNPLPGFYRPVVPTSKYAKR